MVHSSPVRLLAATDIRHKYREEEKGLLADALTSHCDNLPDLHELRIPPDQSSQPDSVHNGCRRSHLSGKCFACSIS